MGPIKSIINKLSTGFNNAAQAPRANRRAAQDSQPGQAGSAVAQARPGQSAATIFEDANRAQMGKASRKALSEETSIGHLRRVDPLLAKDKKLTGLIQDIEIELLSERSKIAPDRARIAQLKELKTDAVARSLTLQSQLREAESTELKRLNTLSMKDRFEDRRAALLRDTAALKEEFSEK